MSQIYCSNCGQLIAESSNFCRFCGAAQHGLAAATYQAQAPAVDVTQEHPAAALGQHAIKQATAVRHHYVHDHKLDDRAQFSFFVAYLVRSSILPLLLVIGIFARPFIAIPVTGLYLITLYIVAVTVHHSFRFSIDETGFKKQYGIIHKQEVSIPYKQIQNVNITRSLLDRFLGLSRVCIETAGGSATVKRDVVGGSRTKAEGHLPGLDLKEAKRIHDLVISKIDHRTDPH